MYFEGIVRRREDALDRGTRRFLETPVPTLEEYTAALHDLGQLRDDIAAHFADQDALLCSVSPMTAFRHNARHVALGEVTMPARHVVGPTAAPFYVTESPALSLPFGSSNEGLPIDVQRVRRQGDGATLLRLGMALELCTIAAHCLGDQGSSGVHEVAPCIRRAVSEHADRPRA